jgi:hypothetical protein
MKSKKSFNHKEHKGHIEKSFVFYVLYVFYAVASPGRACAFVQRCATAPKVSAMRMSRTSSAR